MEWMDAKEKYEDMGSFITIENKVSAEVEEKKSRFIAQLAPIRTEQDALIFLEEVRKEHRMARHNVYAYRVREGERMRYSDDGEPSKTAGLPTLEALRHAELTNVIAVVTRYFGGVLLGTGGLVRAYTQATQAAIKKAQLVTVSRCVDITVCIPYAIYDPLVHLTGQYGVKIADTSFTDSVELRLVVLEEMCDAVSEKLRDLIRDQGTLIVSDAYDAAFEALC